MELHGIIIKFYKIIGDGAITYTMTYKTRKLNGMNYATIDQCKATRKNAYIRYRLHNPKIGNIRNYYYKL